MVKCPKCGAIVGEGKFCEKCGNPLEGAMQIENAVNNMGIDNNKTTNFDNVSNNSAGSLGGFFSNIKTGMNKAATDLMAVKSNYQNATLIDMENKVPNVQEKKIKVNEDEIVYYNNGNGYNKKTSTFTTTDSNFVCFYIKNDTVFVNNSNFSINVSIKNIDNKDDKIKVELDYKLSFKVNDIDKFFHELVSIKQDSWKTIDVNSLLADELKNIISNNLIISLKKDEDLDLRDVKGQIDKFTASSLELINNYVSKYGLNASLFDLSNVNYEIYEINKILIKNLYK